jgi:nucleoside-diphosphate-sugar epimerase
MWGLPAYPKRPLDGYAHSKTLSEQLVRAADGVALATVALRPVHMYGPDDVLLLEAMTQAGLRYPLKLTRLWAALTRAPPPQLSIVGRDNCAHAHVCVARALAERPAAVGGRALMVTEGATFNCAEYTRRAARARGVSDWVLWVPVEALLLLAWVSDAVISLLYWAGLVRPWFVALTQSALVLVAYDNIVLDTTLSELTDYRPLTPTAAGLAQVMTWARTYPFPPH